MQCSAGHHKLKITEEIQITDFLFVCSFFFGKFGEAGFKGLRYFWCVCVTGHRAALENSASYSWHRKVTGAIWERKENVEEFEMGSRHAFVLIFFLHYEIERT